MSETAGKITAADAGCWLDGAMGWHNTYRVIDRAIAYGWAPEDLPEVQRIAEIYKSRDVFGPEDKFTDEEIDEACDAINDVVDVATDYLQSLAPAGYSFQWDDGLYLWADDELDALAR